jgi:peptidoglycan-associated lipoprotein
MSTFPAKPSSSASSNAGARSSLQAPSPESKVTKRSVYYDYDRDVLKPDQMDVIEANAKYLRERPDLKLRIEGNADERGSREYNLALGQRRAEVVMKALSLLGVDASRMESISYGEEHPRAKGHDEQSWAENRRADVIYP